MSTVKGTMARLGTGTGGNVSMLGDFFGFIRQKVPADSGRPVRSRAKAPRTWTEGRGLIPILVTLQ